MFIPTTGVVEERKESDHIRVRSANVCDKQPVVHHARPVPYAMRALPVQSVLLMHSHENGFEIKFWHHMTHSSGSDTLPSSSSIGRAIRS